MEDLLLVARDMGGGRRVMCTAISSGWLEGVGCADETVLYLDRCWWLNESTHELI